MIFKRPESHWYVVAWNTSFERPGAAARNTPHDVPEPATCRPGRGQAFAQREMPDPHQSGVFRLLRLFFELSVYGVVVG